MGQTKIANARVTKTDRESHRVSSDLTVIIPSVGRPILQRCLQSIASGTILPARIVVVDQGENPTVVDWLRNLDQIGLETFHLVSSERSPASARNQGIEQVKTPFLAAIDDDCVVTANWLEKMEILLQQNPKAIITGRLEAAGDGIPPTVVTSDVPYVHKRPSIRVSSPLVSANMGFSVDTAHHIGPFDEALYTAEENDWAYRALRLGIPIVYAPELVVYHLHWRDNAQLAAVYCAYAWNQGAFYGKYLRRGDWSMALRAAITFGRGVRSLIYGVVSRDYGRRADGYARITRLVPGLVAGLLRFGSS